MILRHITHINKLKSIFDDGCLKNNQRSLDKKHKSFVVVNPENDLLFAHFHIIKGWRKEDSFELLFDGDRLEEDGYIIKSEEQFGERMDKKIDIGWMLKEGGVYVPDEALDKIKYVFIEGDVPIKYLTEESLYKLNQWISENK